MPLFCDVALPVPVDRVFTYSIERGAPVVGGRVLVPFRREQLQGVVVALHDLAPAGESSSRENSSSATIRPILRVLDQEPVLSEHLLQLGSWIAEYYLAPLGEVLRTMLPLGAEVRKEIVYSLTPRGAAALEIPQQQTLESNASDQSERAVLSFLAEHGQSRAATLRNKTSASAALLQQLVTRRLIARESTAAARELRTTVRVAVLVPDTRLPKLNENQQRLLAELASAGGRLLVSEIRQLSIPESTLATLVRHELVRIEEVPATDALAGFALSPDLPSSSVPVEAMLNDAQRETMLQISTVSAPRRDRVRQNCCLYRGHATRARRRSVEFAPRSGNWPDAGHACTTTFHLRRSGRAFALGA
jgi:primosomal protein N' (replication factor Y)